MPRSVLALLDLDWPASAPLYITSRGGRVDKDHWRARNWVPARDQLGVEGLQVHDLRHTAASLAIASGANAKVVQRMLGHDSAAMTLDLYGHLLDRNLDNVAGRMDALLAEGTEQKLYRGLWLAASPALGAGDRRFESGRPDHVHEVSHPADHDRSRESTASASPGSREASLSYTGRRQSVMGVPRTTSGMAGTSSRMIARCPGSRRTGAAGAAR